MKKLYIITFFILIIVLTGGIWYQNKILSALNPTPTPQYIPLTPRAPIKESKKVATQSAKPTTPQNTTILYTNAGFNPPTLTVAAGTIVTFRNEAKDPMWPASASHPTHKDYPGSDIAKCATTEATSIFDACQRIPSGKEWSFFFIQKGSWVYHDHLNPQFTGTIVIK